MTDVTQEDTVPKSKQPSKVSVTLTGKSHGHKAGDVIEVSEDRASELVSAGLAKRVA